MLDVRKLQVLLAVAEHGGVAAAARALSFTPPAVSQQLAALERQVGTDLVDRSGRTAVLTDAGQLLARHARDVLAALEVAEADLKAVDGQVRGILRVATIPTLGRVLLPAIIGRLAEQCPGLDLRLTELEPEQSLPALARGEHDLAFAGEYALTPRRLASTLERIDLGLENVYIAVPASYQLAGPYVQLSDLRGARWIAPAAGSSCAAMLDRSCALAGYEPHIVARCADFSVATALVGAGYGVAIVPAIAAPTSGDCAIRLLTAVNPPVTRSLYAAVRRGTRSLPALAHLVGVATDAARQLLDANAASGQSVG